jgi:hypothetical protein
MALPVRPTTRKTSPLMVAHPPKLPNTPDPGQPRLQTSMYARDGCAQNMRVQTAALVSQPWLVCPSLRPASEQYDIYRPLLVLPLGSPASIRGRAKRKRRPSSAVRNAKQGSRSSWSSQYVAQRYSNIKTRKGVGVQMPKGIRVAERAKTISIVGLDSQKWFGVEFRGGLAVRRCLSTPEPVLFLLGRLQDLERAQQALVDAHHRTSVVEFTAVVWRTEQCDELTL